MIKEENLKSSNQYCCCYQYRWSLTYKVIFYDTLRAVVAKNQACQKVSIYHQLRSSSLIAILKFNPIQSEFAGKFSDQSNDTCHF